MPLVPTRQARTTKRSREEPGGWQVVRVRASAHRFHHAPVVLGHRENLFHMIYICIRAYCKSNNVSRLQLIGMAKPGTVGGTVAAMATLASSAIPGRGLFSYSPGPFFSCSRSVLTTATSKSKAGISRNSGSFRC